MPHICVGESGQHWFRKWLGAEKAPSHYLNQCWVIVNWTMRNKIQWNFNRNTKLFFHENTSENIVCEKAAILSRARYVNFSFSIMAVNGSALLGASPSPATALTTMLKKFFFSKFIHVLVISNTICRLNNDIQNEKYQEMSLYLTHWGLMMSCMASWNLVKNGASKIR